MSDNHDLHIHVNTFVHDYTPVAATADGTITTLAFGGGGFSPKLNVFLFGIEQVERLIDTLSLALDDMRARDVADNAEAEAMA